MAATKDLSTDAGSRLAAFTVAALALPGMAVAEGIDLRPEGLEIDGSYSNYQESNGRMSVQAFQNDAALQLGDNVNFRVNSTLDFIGGGSNPMNLNQIGGASPTFYWGKNNYYGKKYGELELSQATQGPQKGQQGGIHDQRLAIDGNLSVALDDVTLGVAGGNSTEWDYISNFFNLDARWDINQKMTTLAAGFGYASDTVWADGGNQGRVHQMYTDGTVIGGDKNTYQGLIGVTQILDKNSLVQLNLTVSNSSGFLSDPYKSAWVNNPFPADTHCLQSERFSFQSNLCADHRPGARTQSAVLLRYVRNIPELNAAALHLDYRFYSDTWNIDSHTFDVSWVQPLPYEIMLTPRVRYYSQRSADFYQTVYNDPTSNGLYSSDYRLASFGAIGGGIQLSKEFFDMLQVGGGVELYQRTQGMGFMGGTGSHVDNYSFALYSVNLNLKF
ncbi:MAG: DUF3570 domain-containing protein [Methylococcus sp.]|nr:DUF3570 domain-containing protein [Methylococcus sp.]